MPSIAVSALIHDALAEIGVFTPGAPVSAEDAAFCLGRLNQQFDNFNALKAASYVERFNSYVFVPNVQDYTIGPAATSPDFTIADARPNAIAQANVILLTVTPTVRNPITIRDYQWWAGLTVRSVTSTFPTDLYYAPDWPAGVLHFWPVPTVAYGLELVTSNTFAQVAMADTLNMPSGYQAAVMLTLAEDVAPAFGRPVTALTVQKANAARARVYVNNDWTPRLSTQDAGMPSTSRNRATFNYRTGLDMSVNR